MDEQQMAFVVGFAQALTKLKMCSKGGGEVALTSDECKALIYGIQLLRKNEES